ncbi:MAG: hypothetical protein PHP01_03280 [Phycisphaerae bacterium]|nr:hypothetical protein [Phycisphaerae bacterium]
MAVAHQGHSNTMLYTVITFVALFLVAAVCAVVFYIKAEDWRNEFLANQQDTSELASPAQIRNLPTLIGQKNRNESRVAQLLGYIDKLYVLFVGIAPQDTSAEVKLSGAESKYKDALAKLPKDMIVVDDPNGLGAISLIEMYDSKFTQTQQSADDLQKQLDNLQEEYDIAQRGATEREEELRTKITAEQERADSVQQSYNQLRELMNKKSTEQVQTLAQQRDDAIAEKDKSRQELLATMSKLSITQNRLKDALSRLEILKPRPMEDISAYQPDGHIISIDISTNIVFIDIGSEDKVYPGLTFSVYDKNAPVPTDGTSKAEIEVFDVDKNTAIARINKSSRKSPIVEGDAIINLIWDSKATNRFVVAGDFDFDDDGEVENDGALKIKQLIENWGGKIEDVVTIDTDFVVLGVPPAVKKKPTLDEIEIDPMAVDKYELSMKDSERYQDVKNQAKDLYIPMFGTKRFLNFIGYESIATGVK